MSRGVAIRRGVVWTSGAGGGDRAVRDALPEALRSRIDRLESFSGIAVAAVAAMLRPGGALRRDVGVAVGTTLGCFATNAAYQQKLAEQGASGASPRLFAATVSNAAAGEIALAFGLGGPSVTLTSGTGAGFAALDAARAEIGAGGVAGMLVAAVDVVDDAARRWIDDVGWGIATPAEQVAVLAIGDEPAALPEIGRLGGVALGRGASEAAVRGVATAACEAAGRRPSETVVYATRAADAVPLGAALGADVSVAERAPLLAAGGLATLLVAIDRTPGAVLVVDRCPSGHVAAAVAWSAAA